MLEFYEAYRDYRYVMELTEELVREVAMKVVGKTTIEYQDVSIDLSAPFDRLTMAEAIAKYNPRYLLAELTKPEYLKASEIEQLQAASRLTSEPYRWKYADESVHFEIALPPHGVASITLEYSPMPRSGDK